MQQQQQQQKIKFKNIKTSRWNDINKKNEKKKNSGFCRKEIINGGKSLRKREKIKSNVMS